MILCYWTLRLFPTFPPTVRFSRKVIKIVVSGFRQPDANPAYSLVKWA